MRKNSARTEAAENYDEDDSVKDQHAWLSKGLRGHEQYYGVLPSGEAEFILLAGGFMVGWLE